MLAGPFLVGACARSAAGSAVLAKLQPPHGVCISQLSTPQWRWWWRWWWRRRWRLRLRSENCPLVQPLWWQQLQLPLRSLWTLLVPALLAERVGICLLT